MIELHFLLIVLQLAYGRYGEVATASVLAFLTAFMAPPSSWPEYVSEQSVRNDGVG